MNERLNRWLYRLVALLAAVGLWYGIVADKRAQQSERLVEASVTYAGRPERLVLLNQVATVNVRLRGNTDDIRRLRPGEVDVQVDLSGKEAGPVNIQLEPEDVLTPQGDLEVLAIEPAVLRLELAPLANRRLPIEVETIGEPAAGALVRELEPNPNTVLVEGPRSVIESLETIKTQPVNLEGHALDYSEEVALLSPDSAVRLILRPPRVTVFVRFELATPGNGGGAAGKGEGGDSGGGGNGGDATEER